jgi:predicted TIM-barrel enzyme
MGNKLFETFKKKKLALPVVHVLDEQTTYRNLELLQNCGADGVFLISHGTMYADELINHRNDVMCRFDMWMGINFLDLNPYQAFTRMNNGFDGKLYGALDGIWTDNAGVEDDNTAYADKLQSVTGNLKSGIYFGGVAFKYQKLVKDLTKVTQLARNYVDVITASGEGTGKAANLDKIITMHEAAEGFPMAIASGVTPDNVDLYLPYIGAFLVATGISVDENNFDLEKTKKFIDKVHSY